MKVGRAALDEDAIRMIEEHHPDIEFDWTRILKGDAEPEPQRRPDSRPPRPERSAVPPAIAREVTGRPDPTATDGAPPPEEGPVSAVQARLGSEGLLRLRGRYAEMMARIGDRVPDAEKQTELKSIAERLNPDAWVTEEDVAAGLDGYEAAFEALRGVVGHRRRRRRRKPQAE